MKKKSQFKLITLVTALVLAMSTLTVFAAPNDSKTVNLSATIDPTTTVAVSTNSINFANINPLTANYTQNLTVTVQSNATYKLTTYATDDFKTADATPKVFGISHLGVKLASDGSYQTMVKTAGTPVTLATNQPATASQVYNVNLQLATDWLNAVPGTYTTSLVFTATQL